MNSRLGLLACLLSATATFVHRQSPAVPIFPAEARSNTLLKDAATALRESGVLVSESTLTNQFDRTSCTLTLPAARKTRLSGRELWSAARAAHVRVGWHFLCTRCSNWHLDLAGGHAITKDGAVATCFHVVKVPANFKEGSLVAADEDGRILPVVEILAGNAQSDACIVRVAATDLKPLPLNTDVTPGDRAFCFSDPLGERGYFSDGIVNRFLSRAPRATNAPPVTRLNVTTDWAPGSSGSAVLDEFGNAIGHVTTISTLPSPTAASSGADKSKAPVMRPTMITLHEAVSAKDVLSLIRKPGKPARR